MSSLLRPHLTLHLEGQKVVFGGWGDLLDDFDMFGKKKFKQISTSFKSRCKSTKEKHQFQAFKQKFVERHATQSRSIMLAQDPEQTPNINIYICVCLCVCKELREKSNYGRKNLGEKIEFIQKKIKTKTSQRCLMKESPHAKIISPLSFFPNFHTFPHIKEMPKVPLNRASHDWDT